MKKILSVFLMVAMLLSSLALLVGAEIDADENWYPVNGKWDPISRDGVAARFVVGGDIHFSYYNAKYKLTAVYDAMKQIGGVDALMIAGDLTHYGYTELYEQLMDVVNANTKKSDITPNATGSSVGTTILSMGNHEYWDMLVNGNGTGESLQERFTECTGYNPCDLYWISGVPVIALSPTGDVPERVPDIEPGNNYDGRLKFLQDSYKTIDDSGYNGPIVIIAHHRTPTDGKANDYYSQEIVDLMKAHPNTVVFTGHSHTWIWNNKEFVVQDAGFTQVRAGSLGNNYGGVGNGFIKPSTGKPQDPFSLDGDINCSCVLVDVMENGTVKLRPMDIAKGKYMYPDDEFIIDPASPDYYMHESSDEGTYASGAQAPSFPNGANVKVEDVGNFSSVYVSFSPAVPATSLAKDFVAEYRIRFKNTETGAYLKNGTKDYFRVGNYRRDEDNDKDWKVLINGLYWDTDYQVEVRAVSAYGKSSSWMPCDTTVNVGHGKATYPAIPVVDFDYIDGSIKDQTGGHKLAYTTTYVDDEVNGRKAVKLRAPTNTSIAYEFREEDFNRIRNAFTMECYFNVGNTVNEQVIFGGWDAARLGFKVQDGQIHVWANILSLAVGNSEDRLVASADIEAKTWYHAVAVCDGNSVKLYLNGELVEENTAARGGLDVVPYEPEEDGDQTEVVQYFCVGGANPETTTPVYTVGINSMISKATLYEGYMTDADVKAAYENVTNPPEVTLPFTDVKASSWFADAVKYVYKKGLMNGKSDTTFVPNEATNRAMLVTILYRMEGSPEVTADVPFTDLKQAWYKDAVAWAYENEIVNGTSATTFDPNGAITRQQMAAILYRYNTFKGYAASERAELGGFPDGGKVQAYAKDAMSWANAVGLITGSDVGGQILLQPRGNATRAQVATILQRYDIKY